MKLILSFILAVSMFMLMSCGDKNASTKLTVSYGMTVTTSNYEGGVVFFGRSSTNKVFSAPLLGQNNQVQIDLDKDVWTLGAVGWLGNTLVGATKCALLKNVTIDTDTKTIELSLDSATCTDPAFGTNWDNSNIQFKGLGLITCGTFYTDMTLATPPLLNSDNPNYCNSTVIEADFKTYAKSAIIEIPSLTPGQAKGTSQLSQCINLTNGKMDNGPNLPSKILPISFELFDEKCEVIDKKKIANYSFNRGLDFDYSSQFDHKYFAPLTNGVPTSSHLYLLATDSRRGQTFFLNSIPKLKCHTSIGSSCNTIPGLPSGIERIIEANEDFYVREADGASCDGGSFMINSINPVDFTSSNCIKRNGKIFARLQEDQISNCTSATPCPIEFNFSDNVTVAFTYIKSSTPELSALNLLYKTVGHEEVTTSTADGKYSLKTLYEDEFTSGALSDVRKIMAPGLIGGMLFPVSNLVDNLVFTISKWEDGAQKSFQVKSIALTNAPIPTFIAKDDNPGEISTSEKFDKQITISEMRPAPQLPQPIIIFRFKNDKQVGMMEEFSHHLEEDSRWVTGRFLTYWNTQNPTLNRTESYAFREEKDLSANVLSTEVSFSRAERDDLGPQMISGLLSSGSGLRVEEYQFNSHRECPGGSCTYKETGSKQLLLLNGTKSKFTSEDFEINNTSQLGFFADSYISDFRKSPDAKGLDSASAKSPNGEYLLRAWNEKDVTSSTYDLKILVKKRGAIKRETTLKVQSTAMIKLQLIIGNDGYPMVSIAKGGYIYALVGIGFQNTTGTPYWIDRNNDIVIPSTFYLSAAPIATNSITDGTLLIEDPTSTTCSNKSILYSSSVGIKSLTYSCTNTPHWGTVLSIANESNSLSNIQVLKHGIYYYISYQLSNLVKVFRTTTLQPAAGTLETPLTGPSFDTGSSVKMIVNDTSVDLVEISSTGELKLSSGINSAIDDNATLPIFGLFAIIDDTPKNFKKSEFCFERRIGSGGPVSLNSSTNICDDFTVPTTSHADPIRLKFKYDIESLNPSDFNSIFSIPDLN